MNCPKFPLVLLISATLDISRPGKGFCCNVSLPIQPCSEHDILCVLVADMLKKKTKKNVPFSCKVYTLFERTK